MQSVTKANEESAFVRTVDTNSTHTHADYEELVSDSTIVQRVTEYDITTGMPVRTTETEQRRVKRNVSSQHEQQQTDTHLYEHLNALRQMYDSLISCYANQMKSAHNDTIFEHEQKDPVATVSAFRWLRVLMLMLSLMAVVFIYLRVRR